MSTAFQYQDVDFGWDNDDLDDFRSWIEVIPSDMPVAMRRFAFPSINAEFAQHLGARGRSTTWLVVMVATALSYITTFEQAMENLKWDGRTYSIIEREVTYPYAYIEAFERDGPLVALQTPWLWGQRYRIRFRILPA